MIQFDTVPTWTYEGKVPSKYTFFEAIALAGLEGKPIRLDAGTQRALLGFAVFGRREIIVQEDGSVRCAVSLCFGTDYEIALWRAEILQGAAAAKRQLHPAVSGSRYFNVTGFEQQRWAA
ncbi:hypothetical protein SB768_25145 [Burkholderia sp. SIMBA_043]|uniref:hypothetical protein n=1 Tax=Burkholderia TaxID=32008 RepID=UPI0005D97573|nr:hypothetical protein [Burkholderia vietnamiensis]AJY03062.1 hypothetical protein AK36_6100 [Burkholderia vietnamiensis LMG 10929]KVM41695.1 hypothetical protein WJ57_29885 [Burkholderia vietnamiensis]KVS03776.1 hypothetical protein WK30_10390 [Burkholderia vietnamiensis]UBI29154.1 hypothetical protein LA325_31210 [Burkholderia vietnamiensis]